MVSGEIIADGVHRERLWSLMMDIARYGATEKGGVNRQALSDEDVAAKNHVASWAIARGFAVFHDEIGNLFVRREGLRSDLPPIVIGSHLDSQPTGGKFDGAYGVAAGLEVLETLKLANFETVRPIEVVSWTNEEGSRFSPGAMGSSVFAGLRSLSDMQKVRDRSGCLLGDALADTLRATNARFRAMSEARIHRYLEAHIEQGPILEDEGLSIGVVSGIQGVCRLDVDVFGEEAHAGTTPRRKRKDALSSASEIIADLRRETEDSEDVLRFTVGRFEVRPGSPNTVPAHVHFSIDLRHPDIAILDDTSNRIRRVTHEFPGPCTVSVKDISRVTPTTFSSEVVDAVSHSASRLGYRNKRMFSGAGHDAMNISKVCPAGMIFVPCLGGISHNEAERATPEDLHAGARVLADVTIVMAQG